MKTSNFLQESAQRTEQLKRQKLMKERRDKDAQCAKDTRQYIKIGKVVCQYFPSLLVCPSASGTEKSSDFDFFEFVLKLHYNNPGLIQRLRNAFMEHRNRQPLVK